MMVCFGTPAGAAEVAKPARRGGLQPGLQRPHRTGQGVLTMRQGGASAVWVGLGAAQRQHDSLGHRRRSARPSATNSERRSAAAKPTSVGALDQNDALPIRHAEGLQHLARHVSKLVERGGGSAPPAPAARGFLRLGDEPVARLFTFVRGLDADQGSPTQKRLMCALALSHSRARCASGQSSGGCNMSANVHHNEHLFLALSQAIRETARLFQEALRVMAEEDARAAEASPLTAPSSLTLACPQ
jgi:hypothetical protein